MTTPNVIRRVIRKGEAWFVLADICLNLNMDEGDVLKEFPDAKFDVGTFFGGSAVLIHAPLLPSFIYRFDVLVDAVVRPTTPPGPYPSDNVVT